MKYIKTIFIFFISLNLSALCAEQSTLTEPVLSADINNATIEVEPHKTETATIIPTKENELLNWDSHLSTLKDNWNASTNAPEPSWTTKAIEIAVDMIKADKDSAEKLKREFLDAMNLQSTTFTADTIAVVTEFNNAIDKSLELSKPVVEESKAESSATEKTSAPEAETTSSSTETTTPTETSSSTETTTPASSTESTIEPEKKDTPKEEEKKEDLITEWKQYLTDMQKTKGGDIDTLIKDATDCAQKLYSSQQMDEKKLIQAFTKAIEAAAVVRQLPSYYKEDAVSDFASMLGVYIPTSADSMNYDQPTQSELTMLAQQEELIAMRHQQIEQDERLKDAEQKAEHQRMITQAALLEATKKQQLSADQWKKTQESLMKAEQRRLTQLQEEADQLKKRTKELELKLQRAEQKAASEKSYFTRAKETVSGLIWGTTEEAKPADKLITKEKQLLEKRQKEIAQEQEKLSNEMRCKREQQELKALKNAEREHELSTKETIRKAELEEEKRECEQIAARNNFERQEKEWPIFMDYIGNMKHATVTNNKEVTKEAIEKATSLINLASEIPSIHILDLELMLKTSFANALLNQQRGNQEHLNTTINQHDFDHAINTIEKKKAATHKE